VAFLRPVPMSKIGVVGLKDDREGILASLYDLGAVQIEPISKEALQYLEPERASETQRRIGDELLRFRGLKSALPAVPAPERRHFGSLDELLRAAQEVPIDDEVGTLRREADQLLTERKSLVDTVSVLHRFSFYHDRYDYLSGRNILAFFGEASSEAYAGLRAAVPTSSEIAFLDSTAKDGVRFLVVVRTEQADAINRLVQQQGISLVAAPRLSGTAEEEERKLEDRRATLDRRLEEIRTRLKAIAQRWYPTVATLEEAFAIENRTAEIYSKLGVSERSFAFEGWVPQRDLGRIEAEIGRVSEGRAFFYPIPTEEEPPTFLENRRGVRRFEFFIRFYSLPEATEWDPTLIFSLVFPVFFGFMLGDWGYGLVILLISIWMIQGFRGARHLPRSGRNFLKLIMSPRSMQSIAWTLLPGCAIAIALGFVFDEFFGWHMFNYLSKGAYVAPIAPDANVGQLLLFAGFVGLGMVSLGYLLGALKEYFHHHPRAAFGKAGGIAFAWGLTLLGLSLLRGHSGLTPAIPMSNPIAIVYYILIAVGLSLLIWGEGIQTGMMGLIETVSHILSYTRLVGILLVSVFLALVINGIFSGGIHSGSILFLIFGVIILVIGQTFNVIVGVFEPGIQGARLIFVEHFSKYYTGNGRPFRPFGAGRSLTLPAPVASTPSPQTLTSSPQPPA